ncbi:MAG: hypothetical protein A2Z03_04480 [Chloroflexi bacterium RBG_16_56_8]|nr:MAG: hypothetical protein A2Z03_04480 [Chloroflexi bacterium RBG_16_56_8]
MSAITIGQGNIQIPAEVVQDDGLIVLDLAATAHLIVRASVLSGYSPQVLRQLRLAIEAIRPTTPSPAYHLYTPQKARVLKDLLAQGYPVSGGEEYFTDRVTNPPSLEEVRQALSSIKGSLSDEVIAEREER